MGSTDLLVTCAVAFVAVFVLLAFLALVMRILVILWPETRAGTDAAVMAAVAATMSTVYPGTRITKVEEER
jgi:hypothetical protein